MVELITVMVVIGILGAIGFARFADNTVFENRAYADQVKALIRYAQKLAIAQNRPVFVRSEPAGFAVCFSIGCGNVAALATAPSGSNSGSPAARVFCVLNNVYVANWMCEARPNANMLVGASNSPRNEFATGTGFFYFDSIGRPYNRDDALGASSFAGMTLSFTSGTSNNLLIIESQTGYVH